jgi:hypothetical protein
MKLIIEKYPNSRFHGLYDLDAEHKPLYGQLVAVFAYKTGALAVKELLEKLSKEIEELRKKSCG